MMRIYTIFFLLVVFLTTTSAFAKGASVSYSGAEVRSKPSVSSSKVLFTLPRYAPLIIVEEGLEYNKVKDYRGREGWLHKSLITDSQGIVITSEVANVRKGPGTNFPVVFKLERGDSGKVLDSQEKWVQIQRGNDKTGWVAKFLTRGL